jgi:hypothetical protein
MIKRKYAITRIKNAEPEKLLRHLETGATRAAWVEPMLQI